MRTMVDRKVESEALNLPGISRRRCLVCYLDLNDLVICGMRRRRTERHREFDISTRSPTRSWDERCYVSSIPSSARLPVRRFKATHSRVHWRRGVMWSPEVVGCVAGTPCGGGGVRCLLVTGVANELTSGGGELVILLRRQLTTITRLVQPRH